MNDFGRKVIMIVLNDVTGDNRVRKMAASIRREGYEVTIFGISKDSECEVSTIMRLDGNRVRLFPDPRHGVGGSIRSHKWDFMLKGLAATMWMFIDMIQPDIIHTHDYNTIRIGQEFISRSRKLGRRIYWIHDLHEYLAGIDSMDDEVRQIAMKDQDNCIRLPEMLLTVSGSLASKIQQDYLLFDCPTTIYNATSIEKRKVDDIRSSIGLDEDTPLMVYTGGVAPQRGVRTVIEALPDLSGVHFCMVTRPGGKYLGELLTLARELRCENRVHIHDYVDPNQVPHFISNADVAVHPIHNYENSEVALPNKLFDYLHSDVPMVVSDCLTMSAFVRRWNLGEVFAAEDVQSFTNAVNAILADRDHYLVKGVFESSLKQRYSWTTQEEKLLEIYRSATSELRKVGGFEPVIEAAVTSTDDGYVRGIINVDGLAGGFDVQLLHEDVLISTMKSSDMGSFAIPLPEGLLDGKKRTVSVIIQPWGKEIIADLKIQSSVEPPHYGHIENITGRLIQLYIPNSSGVDSPPIKLSVGSSLKSVPVDLDVKVTTRDDDSDIHVVLIPERFCDGKNRFFHLNFSESGIGLKGSPIGFDSSKE